MAFIRVNGFPILVADGSAQVEYIRGGDFARSFSGSVLTDERFEKRVWRGSTPPLKEIDALAVRGAIRGLGHLWNYNDDRFSSKGLSPGSTVSSQRIGIADDGDEIRDTSAKLEAKFGKHSFTVEPATTNILNADQRDCEGSVAGNFTAIESATLSIDSTQYIQNSSALKVECPSSGGTQDGCETVFVSASASTEYTASVYIRIVSGSNQCILDMHDDVGQVATTGSIVVNSSTWTRISVTGTTDGAATQIKLRVREHTAASGITFYLDQLQIEANSFATTWADPSRAVGDLEYSPNVFQGASDVTINFWARCPSTNPSLSQMFCILQKSNTDVIRVIRTTNNINVTIFPDEGSSLSVGYTSSPWDGSWHMVSIVFRGSPEDSENNLEIYFDGVSVNTGDFGGTQQVTFENLTKFRIGNATGYSSIGDDSPSLLDDFQVIPYAATAEQVSGWYNMDTGMSPLSRVYVDGDALADNAFSVLAEGVAQNVSYSAGHRSSAFRNNLQVVNFELWEV